MDARVKQSVRIINFEFTGRGAEYFRVWIVNICLSIVTLGIYSAWAKVRDRQYFYGNTLLDGAGFAYLANPVKILKGRLIAAAVLLVYVLTGEFLPVIQILAVLLIAPVLVPWVLNKALAFNAFNSAHRNVRFGFDGTFREAFGVYTGLFGATVLSMGLAYPYAVFRRKQYFVERSRYGDENFSFHATPGQYYMIYLWATMMVIGVAVVGGVLLGMASVFTMGGGPPPVDANGMPQMNVAQAILGVVFNIITVLAFFAIAAYVKTEVSNLTWSNTRLGENRFRLQLRVGRVFWIQLTNMFAIVLSLGLLIPWAKVRMARYTVSCLAMRAVGSLDSYAAAQSEQMSATGEELGEMLDFDVGL